MTGNVPLAVEGSYDTHVLFAFFLETFEGLAQQVVIFDGARGDGVIKTLDLLLRALELLP